MNLFFSRQAGKLKKKKKKNLLIKNLESFEISLFQTVCFLVRTALGFRYHRMPRKVNCDVHFFKRAETSRPFRRVASALSRATTPVCDIFHVHGKIFLFPFLHVPSYSPISRTHAAFIAGSSTRGSTTRVNYD